LSIFYADNDYHKAKKQLEFCEENSDIPSDFDTALKKLNTIDKPRNRKRPNHYCEKCEDSDEESDSEKVLLNPGVSKKKCNNKRLSRPLAILSGNYKNSLTLKLTFKIYNKTTKIHI